MGSVKMVDRPTLLQPAPWQLTGRGFVLVVWFSAGFLRENGFIPPEMAAAFCGGPSVVMLVSYHQSNVGPYDELLFIPGKFRHQQQQFTSITRIFVSTQASVVNGRKNWAIPKEMAAFDWHRAANGRERVCVSQGEHCLADFTFKPVGPALPVSTALIPAGWRTLMQPVNTHLLFTKLQSSGKVKLARCRHAAVDGAYFPDLASGQLLAAFNVSQFEMIFPVATELL